MSENIIETFDLTKIYKIKTGGIIKALNKVNISVKEGEIIGLLGPNGAGKTTLIHILTTLKQPTSGYAVINGYNILKNPSQAKNKIALMLESDMLYYRVTGYDNLKFFCKLYSIKEYKEKIYNKSKEFGLEKWLNEYVEHFSSGMKIKLALCRTLLLERNILILDEPTVGLDIKSISFIIDKLKKSKNTILVTSHDMSVMEKLCNRIAFIKDGNIIKIGTKEDITNLLKLDIKINIRIIENKNQLKIELNQQEFIKDVIEIKDGLIVSIKRRENFEDLLKILIKYRILTINENELSLEDLFLKLI